jgi:hypothetical protein
VVVSGSDRGLELTGCVLESIRHMHVTRSELVHGGDNEVLCLS